MIDFQNQWIQLAIYELIVMTILISFGFYLLSKKR